ncbi:MAG: hypothetical protein K5656_02480 [Lachnospiraceae bacterium]|nr:hypothetical protein [Lachnospiraceae bacterium]
MKLWKRVVAVVLSFAVAVGTLTFVPTTKANAESIVAGDEIEFDGLGFRQTQEFTFTMPGDGYFYFETDNSYGKAVEMIVDYKTILDTGCQKYTSEPFAFAKGSEVKFIFTGTCDSGDNHVKFTINYIKASNFEIESNNVKSKANTITTGKTYTSVMNNYDTDWYVFKAPKKGSYTFSMVDTDRDSDKYLNMDIYSGNSKKLGSATLYGGKGWTTMFKKKMKKGQKIYLKCYQGNGGFEYKFNVKYKSTSKSKKKK